MIKKLILTIFPIVILLPSCDSSYKNLLNIKTYTDLVTESEGIESFYIQNSNLLYITKSQKIKTIDITSGIISEITQLNYFLENPYVNLKDFFLIDDDTNTIYLLYDSAIIILTNYMEYKRIDLQGNVSFFKRIGEEIFLQLSQDPSKLYIFDMRETTLTEKDLKLKKNITDMIIQNDWLYVIYTDNNIEIINMKNPLSDRKLLSFQIPITSPAFLEYLDGCVIIADKILGLVVVDTLADNRTYTLPVQGVIEGINVLDDYNLILIANSYFGIKIVKLQRVIGGIRFLESRDIFMGNSFRKIIYDHKTQAFYSIANYKTIRKFSIELQ